MFPDDFAADKPQTSEELIPALNSSDEMHNQPLPSEFDSLRASLAANPHSPALWKRLVEMAETSGEMEKIKFAFDSLLKQYPNTVCKLPPSILYFSHSKQSAVQISYIRHYLNDPKTVGEAEILFKTFLNRSPSVDLFRFYLTYIR